MDNGGAFTARMLAEAGLVSGMRVLDVGCGNGEVSIKLAALVGPNGHVVGVDRDLAALERARERVRIEGHKNVELVAGDLDGGDLPPGPFDAIVGRRVLMYLPNPRRTLRALRALMRSGGMIAFQEHDSARVEANPLPPIHARLHELLWRTIAAEGGNTHMGFELVPALRDVGFDINGVLVDATMLTPELENPVAQVGALMLPRMIAAGVATAGELDPDLLARQLADERERSNIPLSWETIFGVWARAS